MPTSSHASPPRLRWRPLAVGSLATALALGAAAPLPSGDLPGLNYGLIEDFDDDAVGSAPVGASSGEQGIVATDPGYVYAVETTNRNSVEVVLASGGEGHTLRLSDKLDELGLGHCEAQFLPSGLMGPGLVRVEFDLRADKYYDETIAVGIIDNRTTPGTGRLVDLEMGGFGRLVVNGEETPFFIIPHRTYRFRCTLMLEPDGAQGVFDLRVHCLNWPFDAYLAEGLPTNQPGAFVTELAFSTAAGGQGAVEIDRVSIGSATFKSAR